MRLTMVLPMGATTKCCEATAPAPMSVGNTTGVVTCSDTFGAEDVVEVVAAVFAGMDPALDSFVHCSVGFVVHVS